MLQINIKKIREKQGITLERLEELSGVSKTHINDIERGKKSPTLIVLYKLAKGLNCNINELYSLKD